jgi:glyceraldehyde 3-phosphate dehydrogenase
MQSFGIKRGLMTTIHSYTNDQQLLDLPHKDLRRARAAALSMIPTSTGAAKALSEVLPDLAGKLDGMAIRVPTPNVSVIDLVVELETDVTEESVRAALSKAAQKEMAGILMYTEAPLVSSDYNGNPHSSIVDGMLTKVIGNRMAKVISWYDNEWAYSCRVRDLILYITNKK